MNGLAGPLETLTMIDLVPMLIDLKFNPVRASCLSLRHSGSRACWAAISSQSIPKSRMALMTQLRSVMAVSDFAADAAQ